MSAELSVQARVLRAFAVEFLTAHDPDVARRIMTPDYALSIGGFLLAGRDEHYLPATVAQLEQFPGLCVTAHDVVIGAEAVALHFTEHGVSARQGSPSSWGGITLFRLEAGRLRQGWAEEDYFARKLQLRSGEVNRIDPPHPAPWDAPVAAPDPQTERIVRSWLSDPAAPLAATDEISAGGPRLAELIESADLEIGFLFTAGPRAAFHAVLKGTYRGGFADMDQSLLGTQISLPVAGIVDAANGAVARAQVCGDRLGLQRRLAHG